MVPVKKECAKAKMSPSKLFTTTARCDQGTDNHFRSEETTRVEPFPRVIDFAYLQNCYLLYVVDNTHMVMAE